MALTRKHARIANSLDRRNLLQLASLTAAAACCWQLLQICTGFLLPPRPANTFGGTVDLGPLSQLPGSGDPPLFHDRGRLWLVHGEQGLCALHRSCTHLDCRFSWNQEEELFICPCHGSRFAWDGEVRSGPATRSLDRYPLQVIAPTGETLASTDLSTGAPLKPPPMEVGESDHEPVPEPRLMADTGRLLRGASASNSG